MREDSISKMITGHKRIRMLRPEILGEFRFSQMPRLASVMTRFVARQQTNKLKKQTPNILQLREMLFQTSLPVKSEVGTQLTSHIVFRIYLNTTTSKDMANK